MRRRRESAPNRSETRALALTLPVAVIIGVLAVGGCAGGAAERPGETPTEGGTSVTASGGPPTADPGGPGKPSTAPATRPPAEGGPNPSGPSAATTLTGTVTAGVEPNCLLLDGYLLIGGPRDVVKPGARVTVTGRVEPGLMTTCQQGTPFRVESARSA